MSASTHTLRAPLLAGLTALCLAGLALTVRAEEPITFWPSPEWTQAAPIEEGMSQDRLEDAFQFCEDRATDALLVVRSGRVVGERYWREAKKETRKPAPSLAQGLLSLLVGVAIHERFLTGLDQKASDVLTEWKGTDREAITVRHLLAMTSGLTEPRGKLARQDKVRDPTGFGLNLPLTSKPGSAWRLSDGVYRLLFAVLERATGRPVDAYAKEKLLDPMGMKQTRWRVYRSQEQKRLWDVETTARDVARLGLLLLRKGAWNGLAVVPAAHVKAATAPSQRLNGAFGLLFWVNGSKTHLGPGGGRRPRKGMILPTSPVDAVILPGRGMPLLTVVPSLDLIVVRLGANPRKGQVKRRENASDGLVHRACLAVNMWKGTGRTAPRPAPAAEPSLEALQAKLSELHVARRHGDIIKFREIAAEIQALWAQLPPDMRERLEKRYPGISRRIAEGFE